MFGSIYSRRIRADVERWAGEGFITPQGLATIRRELDDGDGRSRLPMVIGTIGMICVALALAAFIAANWDDIPRAVKLAGIALLVTGSHALSAWIATKGKPGIADLVSGFGSLSFVGGMALVGQIFHLPQDWVGGSFLVMVGALAAAYLASSRASLAVAALAAMSWQKVQIDGDPVLLTALLLACLAALAILVHSIRQPFALSRWLGSLVLYLVFIRWLVSHEGPDVSEEQFFIFGTGVFAAGLVTLGYGVMVLLERRTLSLKYGQGIYLLASTLVSLSVLVLGLAAIAALWLILDGSGREMGSAPVLGLTLISAAMAGAGILAMLRACVREPSVWLLFASVAAAIVPLICVASSSSPTILAAASALAFSILLSAAGLVRQSRGWTLTGFAAFAGIALILLYETIGGLLGQSLFFLIAGVLLLVLAVAASKLMRRTARKAAAESGVTP